MSDGWINPCVIDGSANFDKILWLRGHPSFHHGPGHPGKVGSTSNDRPTISDDPHKTNAARIPIRIQNVVNPRNPGTIIMPDDPESNSHTISSDRPKLFRTRSSSILKDNKPKRPTAVTIKPKIIVINVHSNKRTLLHDFYQGIFSTLSKWRLSVDLISTSEVHVSMALHSESAVQSGGDEDETEIVDHDLRSAISELQEYGTTDIIDGMAIVSLVGTQMKNLVGIAGRMFSVLGGKRILARGKQFSIDTLGREQHQH